MSKSWMSITAGILDIVSGALGLFTGFFMTFARHTARTAGSGASVFGFHAAVPTLPATGLAFHPWIGIALIVISIVAIVGGVFALRVKNWGMALAGSICAVISGRLMGVVALILIAIAKKDFDRAQTSISSGS